ncbi:hypothetical protein [Mucilaginibacter lappiensis]|uniref:Uncharacterized protein n=1 Tax=Mucilaginibacter lappiensis TaxID=354630 RepID=A0A1N6NJ71_9SPHI|nr:hypothetical protein [Mucilaginibacter lappiensis]MBB6107932.1 hypothetical protein [Mucilaginibacter lappiensis]MBB6125997.1 hypothetical protein [Mucilaginibacter lappiensis]SIP92093.1 hypothetical protein SAMN05421821_101153 [Mucilaginibacter lappiensis]
MKKIIALALLGFLLLSTRTIAQNCTTACQNQFQTAAYQLGLQYQADRNDCISSSMPADAAAEMAEGITEEGGDGNSTGSGDYAADEWDAAIEDCQTGAGYSFDDQFSYLEDQQEVCNAQCPH